LLITDAILEVQCTILKDTGTVPDSTKAVAPVNNVLNSLFEAVRITINDVPITSSPSDYPYKCYISDLLSFSTIVKGSQLQSQGYYPDVSGHMDSVKDNGGFTSRNQLFREGGVKTAAYKKSGTVFIGKLRHDLSSCQSGLPPHTKLHIELDRSSDAFVLLKDPADTDNYQLKILNISLLMPIGQLTENVYNDFNTRFASKPAAISYRKVEIRPLSVPRNSAHFFSELLFSDEMPTKIICCFIEGERKRGNFTLNPFVFKRKWTVPKTQSGIRLEENDSREKNLERRLQELENRNRELLAQLKGKGPRRGKRSRPSTSAESFNRFVEFTGRDYDDVSITSDESQNLGAETKDVFIKKIDLTLNGSSIDQLEDFQTADDAMQMFWRMIAFNGLADSPFSNGISYHDFKNGFFFATFDLSTSGKSSGSSFLVPRVRLGKYIFIHVQNPLVNIKFSISAKLKLFQNSLSKLKLFRNSLSKLKLLDYFRNYLSKLNLFRFLSCVYSSNQIK